jgi:mRNA-degrading endonuclease RelE of RelBE toxin-antitoxin system
MTIKIEWRMKAVKQFSQLPDTIQRDIGSAVQLLYAWPQVKNIKKLVNRNDYRLAVGRYRVIFTVGGNGVITVIRVMEVKKRDERTYS